MSAAVFHGERERERETERVCVNKARLHVRLGCIITAGCLKDMIVIS